MTDTPLVIIERTAPFVHIRINRPQCRNAVNRQTADALADAFRQFEQDDELAVAILSGVGEHFCAGADLAAVASGEPEKMNR
ncbi:MAG: enoyl-CoA hydratase/isomerase family protein, partial [Alcanivoracaceae bacterium]|nr:enoyl-CoA hydratase/isomerase family protein [Alcanivoracaceae bacterium]